MHVKIADGNILCNTPHAHLYFFLSQLLTTSLFLPSQEVKISFMWIHFHEIFNAKSQMSHFYWLIKKGYCWYRVDWRMHSSLCSSLPPDFRVWLQRFAHIQLQRAVGSTFQVSWKWLSWPHSIGEMMQTLQLSLIYCVKCGGPVRGSSL